MKITIIVCTLLVIFLFGVIFFSCTLISKVIWNRGNKKMYKNQKEVEDTCRSMMASYNSDKLIYEQYKDSELQEKRWANTTYNEYFFKNFAECYEKEIGRLIEENHNFRTELYEKEIKQKTIKEFVKKLDDKFCKFKQHPYDTLHNYEIYDSVNTEIDDLLKEYGMENGNR